MLCFAEFLWNYRRKLRRRRACRRASTSHTTCVVCWWMTKCATSLARCCSSSTATSRNVNVSIILLFLLPGCCWWCVWSISDGCQALMGRALTGRALMGLCNHPVCAVFRPVSSPFVLFQSSRLGLSHWDPYAVHRGGCLELYYCNMVEWCRWDSSLIWKTNWFPSVLWHCWFGHIWPVKIVPDVTYMCWVGR